MAPPLWGLPDYYSLFGVDTEAPSDIIRQAYRRLVLVTHPDKVGDASGDGFHLLQEAYEVLRDEARRAEYDEMLLLSRRVAELRRAAAAVDDEMAASGSGSSGGGADIGTPTAMSPEADGSRGEKWKGGGGELRGTRSRVDEALRRRVGAIPFGGV